MAPDFTTLYKRWSTGTPRKEDMILDIHNDHSRGSKNIFTDEQLGLFEKIIKEVDEFYKHDSLDCDICISGMEPKVPIFLVPYTTYLKRMKNWCNSPFAQKMRQKYEAELEELTKKEYNQEEYNKRLQKLKKKYAPWICSHYPCKGGCARKWQTPLGWFDPVEYEICICLDRIIETYPDKVDTIAAKVLLHELGHALMYNPNHLFYETAFEYWAEESLANKIALKYLFAASKILKKPELFTDAKNMVANQDEAYKFGLYVFEKNALDWRTLRDYKTNINECKGNLWVDAACEDTSIFLDIQKLFYDAFTAKSIVLKDGSGAIINVLHFDTANEVPHNSKFLTKRKPLYVVFGHYRTATKDAKDMLRYVLACAYEINPSRLKDIEIHNMQNYYIFNTSFHSTKPEEILDLYGKPTGILCESKYGSKEIVKTLALIMCDFCIPNITITCQ